MGRRQPVLQFLARFIRFINIVQVLHLQGRQNKKKSQEMFVFVVLRKKLEKVKTQCGKTVSSIQERFKAVLTWLVEMEVRFTLV